MFLAIVQFWFVAHVICGFLKPAAVILVTGGIFLAFTQLFPVLQIFAGMAALQLCGRPMGEGQLSNAAAFAATTVAGLELLAVAALLGGTKRAVMAYYDVIKRPGPRPDIPIPDTAVIDRSASRLSQQRSDSLS